ncbi:isochorismatase family cysteine hydrolase [Actinoplanes sp. NPDC024001]|uniref:cysteine hydrolase family protein n=1 Tax=Actinoplanes sp. NPDC024001 TaxID=3154598 RepID=UPI0033CCBD12
MAAGYTEPHWSSSALVVIDMQVDFAEGGALPIAGTGAVTPNVRRLADGYRRAGLPIVHIVRLYPPGSSDVDLPRRAFIEAGGVAGAPGTPGSAVIAGIAAPGEPLPVDADVLLAGKPQVLAENEIVLFKPRWGAFYRTELEGWLRDRQVDTVVVAGCNLPNCPRATLFEASERDFRTVLAEDAVSQVSAERLADLAGIGVVLATTGTVLDGVSAGD